MEAKVKNCLVMLAEDKTSLEWAILQVQSALDESKQAGIREVVEFVDNNFWKRAVSYEEWQAFKKAKGVEC